jgi:hypothetical protein
MKDKNGQSKVGIIRVLQVGMVRLSQLCMSRLFGMRRLSGMSRLPQIKRRRSAIDCPRAEVKEKTLLDGQIWTRRRPVYQRLVSSELA